MFCLYRLIKNIKQLSKILEMADCNLIINFEYYCMGSGYVLGVSVMHPNESNSHFFLLTLDGKSQKILVETHLSK